MISALCFKTASRRERGREREREREREERGRERDKRANVLDIEDSAMNEAFWAICILFIITIYTARSKQPPNTHLCARARRWARAGSRARVHVRASVHACACACASVRPSAYERGARACACECARVPERGGAVRGVPRRDGLRRLGGAALLGRLLPSPVPRAGWALALSLFLSLSDRKSTRLNSSHITRSRMPSSA